VINAIVVDIDGTISNAEHRVHLVNGTQKKDWKLFNELSAFDPPYTWCVDLVKGMYVQGYAIIFLTAREGSRSTEKITRDWLDINVGIPYELMMRPYKDFRKDFIVKQEIYQTKVAPFYDVAFAIDDKQEVCDMYASMGLRVLNCNKI
jgi:hypothetical protein